MITMHFFGEGATFEHIGIAVNEIPSDFTAAGATYEDPIQKVEVTFGSLHGLRVELIRPLTPDSPVHGMLAKGVHGYHACFRVPDLNAAVKAARAAGFRPFSAAAPAVAFGGAKIIWLHHGNLGVFELVEDATLATPPGGAPATPTPAT